jgi:hypothetical protein
MKIEILKPTVEALKAAMKTDDADTEEVKTGPTDQSLAD